MQIDAGNYITPQDIDAQAQKELIATIKNEGEYIVKTFRENGEEPKKLLELEVSTPIGDKKWCPNLTAQREIIKAWGRDSKNWIGRSVKLTLIKVIVKGQYKDSIAVTPMVVKTESI